MNFDDMKNAWTNDSGNEVSLPKNLNTLKTAGTPVDQLSAAVKKELIVQSIFVVFMAFFPLLFKFNPVLYLPYYCLYTVSAVICSYYIIKFYSFRQRLNHSELSSKDNLYEIYYDVKLYVELYKSWCYSLSPFGLLFLFLFVFNIELKQGKMLVDMSGFTTGLFVKGALITIPLIVLAIVSTEFWVRRYYGKYVKELKAILDELRED